MRTIRPAARVALGLSLSALVAGAVTVVSHGQPWRSFAPVVFAAAVILLAWRFGAAVGLFGSIIGAIMFAYFLYPPLYSIRVESPDGRNALAWMLLAAVTLSFLLLPPHLGGKKK